MKFYLVRHVETTGNVEHRFAGVTETQYTPKGEKQFQVLVKRLADELKVDAIYSSPISRAFKIAQWVGEETNLPVEVRQELSEIHFGVFENHKVENIPEEFKEYWDAWNEDVVHYQIPGGESLMGFHQRVSQFTDSLKDQDGSVLVVCHGGPIQSMLIHLLGLDITQRWHFFIPLGGLVEVHYEQGFGTLNRLISMVDGHEI
jgi:broad specificity phosphatase PhoE